MALIGQLEVGVRADTTNFVKGMQKSRRETESFLGSLSGLKILAVGAIGALTAGFTIAALRRVSKSIALQKRFADQVGISFEKLQELQFAAEQFGASADNLNSSLVAMQRSLVLALDVSGPTAKALAAIGLSAKELLQLSVDKQFLEIAKALKTWEGQLGQNIIAQQIFGSGSKKIIALLRSQTGEIEATIDSFKELDVAISDIDAEKIIEAESAIKELKKSFESTKNFLVAKLAPIVTKVINRFIDFQKSKASIDLVNVSLRAMESTISRIAAVGNFVKGIFQFVASVVEIVIAKISRLAGVVAEFLGEEFEVKALQQFADTAENFGKALEFEAGLAFDKSLKEFQKGINNLSSDDFGKSVVATVVKSLKDIEDEATTRAERRLELKEAARVPDDPQKLKALIDSLKPSKRFREQDIGQFQEINTSLVDVAAIGRTGQRIENKQLDEQKKGNKLLQGIRDTIGGFAVTAP